MARSNKTRFALLGILSMRPASGYEIKKMMQQSTNHFWREGDSSIYPILKQLLDEGMVSCEVINIESDKPKKVYTLTDEGYGELQDWLAEDPILFQSRNELLLKVFFGWNVETQITVKHIEKFRNNVKTMLDKYQDTAKKFSIGKPFGDTLYRFLTLKAGIIYSEASIQWCNDAIKMLNNEIH